MPKTTDTPDAAKDLAGGCACGAVRYRLASGPMFVHCCHCLDCQRQTGSAFVINALIEGAPTFEAYYDSGTLWPAESLARRDAILPR